MVNTEEFTNRLKKVMEYHKLTASLFADKVGVQRSSISHILSGRNKPSLDFVLKVTTAFTDVDIYWLLNGKGNFPQNNVPAPTLFSEKPSNVSSATEASDKKIKRILVFYTDGTFEEYHKNS